MNMRDLLDSTRLGFVKDSSIAPVREIKYIRFIDDSEVTLPSFVGNGFFNKEERELLGRVQSFGALELSTPPEVGDTVQYDGSDWKVTRYSKFGQLYNVFTENKRHNSRPTL